MRLVAHFPECTALALQLLLEADQLLHVDAAAAAHDHQQGAQGSRQTAWKTNQINVTGEVLKT